MHIPIPLLSLLLTLTTATPSNLPPPKGLKIQWMGHSLLWFLPDPVALLATEFGIQDHTNIGLDKIGISLPCEHWDKGGTGPNATNPVKEVLKAGLVDILAMSTREQAPDFCIPKFASLAFENKQGVRVMVHETWLPILPDQRIGWYHASDDIDLDMLERTRMEVEVPFNNVLRGQLAAINQGVRRNLTTIVPVWSAILSLRECKSW